MLPQSYPQGFPGKNLDFIHRICYHIQVIHKYVLHRLGAHIMDLDAANKCWINMQAALREQLGEVRFGTWFKSLQVHSADNKTLVLHAREKFITDYINNKYKSTLLLLATTYFGEEFDNILILPTAEVNKLVTPPDTTKLNPKYTFDTFIVGQSNSLAHAASLAVAESPGTEYNPLFIYGGAGLGKTHLMTAIANYVLASDPSSRIVFSNSEKFTNEVVDAIRQKRTRELRDRMRSVDLLFIDDIQFLSNRTATQEEFFNTFNELYLASKQIVITSDRPPDEISTLQERMRSRFKSGVVVDIGKPDLETRMAILRSKAANEGIQIDEDAISYIAERIDTNIRELEGGLTNARLLAKVEGSDVITLDIAGRSVKESKPVASEKPLSPEAIIASVAAIYGVSADDILSARRSREFTVPRQLAIYLTRELCAYSTTRVGDAFGRDHSTVLHACKKAEELMEQEGDFRDAANRIIAQMGK